MAHRVRASASLPSEAVSTVLVPPSGHWCPGSSAAHRRTVKSEWATRDSGTLTLRCASLEDFRRSLAQLRDEPQVIFDGYGNGTCVRARESVDEPVSTDLPCDV